MRAGGAARHRRASSKRRAGCTLAPPRGADGRQAHARHCVRRRARRSGPRARRACCHGAGGAPSRLDAPAAEERPPATCAAQSAALFAREPQLGPQLSGASAAEPAARPGCHRRGLMAGAWRCVRPATVCPTRSSRSPLDTRRRLRNLRAPLGARAAQLCAPSAAVAVSEGPSLPGGLLLGAGRSLLAVGSAAALGLTHFGLDASRRLARDPLIAGPTKRHRRAGGCGLAAAAAQGKWVQWLWTRAGWPVDCPWARAADSARTAHSAQCGVRRRQSAADCVRPRTAHRH